MFDEDILGRAGAALHAVDHDDIGARLHRQGRVVISARGADLDVDRLFPVGNFAQFLDLDGEVVRTGPVGMAAGAALVDAEGQRAHGRDAVVHFPAEQHAAAAGFRTLAEDDFDRIGGAQIIGIHPVARGQILVNKERGVLSFLRRHAAVARGGRGADFRSAPAQGLLGVGGKGAKAHAGNGDGSLELNGLSRKAAAQDDVGGAALAVAFERIARHARAEENQVVEMGQATLGAPAADVVNAGFGGAPEFRG